MNLPPKDYTKQENIIADCLSEIGLRYVEQYDFFPYTVDFFVPELNMVIEADGVMGHLKKRDAKRDMFLSTHHEVEYVLHINETTKKRIKDTLWQGLNKLNPHPENQDH
mgnify:FL=1